MSAGGSPAIIARYDYLPFGEEIPIIGSRTSGQQYGVTDSNRQKYGLTERDDVTGLDHAWFRKHENRSGRWTSPDPLGGSIAAPQSFNAYIYAANDPVNRPDPSGMKPGDSCVTGAGTPVIEGNDGKCYEGPKEVVTVPGPSRSEKLIESRGADHGLDYGWLSASLNLQQKSINPEEHRDVYNHIRMPVWR